MKLRVRNFMKELGFRACGDLVYGTVEGYLISITDRDGVASLFAGVFLTASGEIQREKIRNFIEQNTNQFSILRAEVQNTGVQVYFDGSSSGFGKLKDFLFILVRQLAALGIPGASVCGNCGQPLSSVSIVHINGSLHACDADCAAMLETRAEQEGMNRKKRRTRFVPGAAGAVFGAALAVIPYGFLVRAGFFTPWFGLVVALFVKGGYEVFSGKPGVGKGIVVPLFSLVSSAAAVFASYCFSMLRVWNEDGFRFAFEEAFRKVTDALFTGGELRVQFLRDTGLVFGFALLGLLLSVRFVKKEDPRRVYTVS